MDWLSLGGALLGGLSSGNSQQSTTADRSPWGPAQGWLTGNLGLGQSLQNSYMSNPLSQLQANAYGNSFATTGLGRNIAGRMLPQLSSTTFFDRTNPLGRPTPFSFVGGDMGGAGTAQNGSLGLGGVMPTGYGPTVNSSGNGVAAIPTMANRYGSDGSHAESGPSWYSTTTPEERMAFFQEHPTLGSITGFLNENIASAPYIGGMIDKNLAAQYAAEARGTYSPNAKMSLSDQYSQYGAGRAAAEAAQAADYYSGIPSVERTQTSPAEVASMISSESYGGGGASTGVSAESAANGPGDGTAADYAKGGVVKKRGLVGPDPKGPDEGKANLQSGEYVIKKSAVKKYGKSLLDDINSKRFTKKQGK